MVVGDEGDARYVCGACRQAAAARRVVVELLVRTGRAGLGGLRAWDVRGCSDCGTGRAVRIRGTSPGEEEGSEYVLPQARRTLSAREEVS